MDCPSCQSFNSVLDEECCDCGFPLPPPRRTGQLYRCAASKPGRGVRRRLKRWARLALAYDARPSDLASLLVHRGYDESWSRELVQGLEPLELQRLGFWDYVWRRIWLPSPVIRRRRLWLALALFACAILPMNASIGDTSLRGAGGGLAQPCEMGLSAICTDSVASVRS